MSDDSLTDKPRLMEVPSPFAFEPGTVRLLESGAGLSSDALDRLREGTLGRPFMIDFGGIRNLFFTLDAVQSSMRMDDPNALVAPYTRKMMAFLLFRPAPRHVLMIGLGGGSLAKFCYRHLPHTRISVVEISAEIIALRDHFAIPRDDERFEIIHDDGASFLAKLRTTADVVLIDAFDDVGVSPSLAAPGFYKAVARRMTPDGVLVLNLSGLRSRYAAHVEGVRAAFPGLIRLVPVHGEDNVLLFALGHRHPQELPEFLQQRAHYLERGLGLEFSRYLERLRVGHTLDARCADLPPSLMP
ncbi:MAG: fused MFS/spermidine synthase [Gammaproteobacteria bacterium]